MKFKLSHSNINVTDMERSLEFYEKALGLTIARDHTAKDGSFRICHLTAGSGVYTFEITWLRDKVGPYDLGDNESHIAFVTDDYEAAHQLHREMGVICYENPNMGIYFIEDPDGYWLEILPQRR